VDSKTCAANLKNSKARFAVEFYEISEDIIEEEKERILWLIM